MSKIIKRGANFGVIDGQCISIKPMDLSPIDVVRHAADGTTLIEEDPATRVEREADIILRTARAEAESVRQEAHREGYAAGAQEVANAAAELIQRLESDIASVALDREAVLDAIEPEVLKLCIEAVEKIIRHEIKTDPRVVMRTIRSCVRRVKDTAEVYIRVNPDEVEFVRAQRQEILSIAEGIHSVNIIDDRRVPSGGCVLESSTGEFDATIGTQINRLNKKLMETYENDRRDKAAGTGEIQEGDQPV